MEYTRYISLDVNAISTSTVIRTKQGDNSTRFINITLTKDQVRVIPESGAAAQFRLEKPDNHAVLDSATINADGTITVELTSQCTAVVGKAKADIAIMKDGNCLSTVMFYIEVLPSPDVARRGISSDEFLILNTAVERAERVYEKLAIFGFSAETDGHIYVWNAENLDNIDFVLQPNGHMEVIYG